MTTGADLPLVSVVIIFLNEERYLSTAIDSVRVQDYPSWELILVDDGSTDGSAAIAKAAQRGCPQRIQYLQHPGGENRGMGKSRNLGMTAASGQYISFLDADDFFMPSKISIQVQVLRSNPGLNIVGSRYLLLFTDEREKGANHQIQNLEDLAGRHVKGRDLIWRMNAKEALTPQHGTMLMTLTAARAVGGFSDQFQGFYEDSSFFTKILAMNDIYILDECLVAYRMHWDSFCHRAMDSNEYPYSPLNAIRFSYNKWLILYLGNRPNYRRLRFLIYIELLSFRIPRVFPFLKGISRFATRCDKQTFYRLGYRLGFRKCAPWKDPSQQKRIHDLAIAEVSRFYRLAERMDDLEQHIKRMRNFA